MSIKSLEDLFEHTLKDIYFAENHIHKSLPKVIDNVSNAELKRLFTAHRDETKGHIQRLEKVFAALGKKPSGEECPAIEGITKEAEELIDEVENKTTLDAAMIAAGQAVEHYEITRYGTLITWAEELGYDDVISLLRDNLSEEKDADSKLTRIAEDKLNKKAA